MMMMDNDDGVIGVDRRERQGGGGTGEITRKGVAEGGGTRRESQSVCLSVGQSVGLSVSLSVSQTWGD